MISARSRRDLGAISADLARDHRLDHIRIALDTVNAVEGR